MAGHICSQTNALLTMWLCDHSSLSVAAALVGTALPAGLTESPSLGSPPLAMAPFTVFGTAPAPSEGTQHLYLPAELLKLQGISAVQRRMPPFVTLLRRGSEMWLLVTTVF